MQRQIRLPECAAKAGGIHWSEKTARRSSAYSRLGEAQSKAGGKSQCNKNNELQLSRGGRQQKT